MGNRVQLRHGTAAQATSANEILLVGEIGFETDTKLYKIGDGVSPWNALSYAPLSGEFQSLLMDAGPNPSPPAAGKMLLYCKAISGRILPKIVGPSGLDTALQPFLARNKVGYWCPQGNSTVVPGVLGYTAPTSVGTATARNITVSNTFQRMRRLGYVSAATAGSLASTRVAVAQITVGDGSGNGGFHTICRFGTSDAATVAGARMFMGISSSISAPTNVEPSTLLNSIGVGHGAADTNLKLYYGGSTAQAPIDLGSSFPANTLSADPYELALFSPSSVNANVYWEVTNIASGAVASGLLNGTPGTQIPNAATLLSYLWAYRSNNTTALAVGLDVMSDYIETDV